MQKPDEANRFWNAAYARLGRLHRLSARDRDEIEQLVARKVPKPAIFFGPPDMQPSLRWKGITMRKTLLALAAAATLAVSAASPAYAGPRYDYGPGGNPYPRTYSGPGGYPYWSGYVDAPVSDPTGPCY